MKRLIKMTDFVLNETNNLQSVFNYANFLKKPLTLSMFVPTDENGFVLEELSIFNTTDEDYIFNSDAFDKYQQAKSKVIFDGFEWNTAEFCDEPMIELEDKKGNYLLYDCEDKNFQNADDEFISIIEDLIPYNLTLTDNVKI